MAFCCRCGLGLGPVWCILPHAQILKLKRLLLSLTILAFVFRDELIAKFRVAYVFTAGVCGDIGTALNSVPLWLLAVVCLGVAVFYFKRGLQWLSDLVRAREESWDVDSPILTQKMDKLERGGYVVSLLGLIKGWKNSESQVIGVYGEWGDGKTSVVNIAKEIARREKDYHLTFVYFNPWGSVRRDDLNAELFACISKGLRWYRNPVLAVLFASYACRLSTRVFSAPSGVNLAFGWVVAELLSLVTGLDYIKRKLKEAVACYSKRIVVIVDDVDRLNSDDAISLIRCIKTNGDLPNVTYLILSEEKRLAKMVEADIGCAEDGKTYLEKIVQLPMPLWPVDPLLIRKELRRLLEDVCSRQKLAWVEFKEEDLDFCLEKFSNLRQIKRLVFVFESTLVYYVALQSDCRLEDGRCCLDLSISDVLRLVAVRLKCPSAVGRFYHFYDEWIRIGFKLMSTGYDRAEKEMDPVIQQVEEPDRDWFNRFLSETMLIKKEKGDGGEARLVPSALQATDVADFGIAYASNFRRYFCAHDLPATVVSGVDRQRLADGLAHQDGLNGVLDDLQTKYGVHRVLEMILNAEDGFLSDIPLLDMVGVIHKLIVRFEEYYSNDEGKFYRTAFDACMLLGKYLDDRRARGLISEDEDKAVLKWLLDNRSYLIALHLFSRAVHAVAPNLACDATKLPVNIAEDYFKMIQAEVSLKFLDADILSCVGVALIQKWFVGLMMEVLPVDGEMYMKNEAYIIDHICYPHLIDRLEMFWQYRWGGVNSSEFLSLGNLFMNHRTTYLNCLEKVEEGVKSHFHELKDDEVKKLVRMTRGKGFQTRHSKEVDDLVRTRFPSFGKT